MARCGATLTDGERCAFIIVRGRCPHHGVSAPVLVPAIATTSDVAAVAVADPFLEVPVPGTPSPQPAPPVAPYEIDAYGVVLRVTEREDNPPTRTLTFTRDDGSAVARLAYTLNADGSVLITTLAIPDGDESRELMTLRTVDEVRGLYGPQIDFSPAVAKHQSGLVAAYRYMRPRAKPGDGNPHGPDDLDADLSGYVPDPTRPGPAGPFDDDRLTVALSDPDMAIRVIRRRYERERADGWVVPTGPGWVQTHETEQLSGHKLHVAAESMEQVVELVERLHPIATAYGLGLKFASASRMSPSPDLADDLPEAVRTPTTKAATVYLPRRATLDRDTSVIVEALSGYVCAADIPGDTHVAGAVWHRFELERDPRRDVDDLEYRRMYRPAP